MTRINIVQAAKLRTMTSELSRGTFDLDGLDNQSDSDLDDVPLTLSSQQVPERVSPFNTYGAVSKLRLNLPNRPSLEGEPQRLMGAPSAPLSTARFHLATAGPAVSLDGPLLTTRGAKPPKLLLPNPATASPVSSPAAHACFPAAMTEGVRTERLTVELLSSAFSINVASLKSQVNSSDSVRDIISRRCSAGFGVLQEELKFYELKELAAEDGLVGCTHIGVMVKNSSFSLTALEDMLAQNKTLTAAAERHAQIIDTIHKDYRESTQNVARLSTRAAEFDVEKKLLHQKCKHLEEENEKLRQQLQHSNDHRHKLYKALSSLRKDFEELRSKCGKVQHSLRDTSVNILADSGPEDMDMPLHNEGKGTMLRQALCSESDSETDKALPQLVSISVDSKSLILLQRLCNDSTIAKLEGLLSKLELA